MSGIKRGALVKAWDDNVREYDITTYYGEGISPYPFEVVSGKCGRYKNAIEIPHQSWQNNLKS